jgi:hypothetical protein
MPKRVDRKVIEHWRDGDLIESIQITEDMIQLSENGTARVIFPPGQITLATGDELHFDAEGIIERLKDAVKEVRPCPKKRN